MKILAGAAADACQTPLAYGCLCDDYTAYSTPPNYPRLIRHRVNGEARDQVSVLPEHIGDRNTDRWNGRAARCSSAIGNAVQTGCVCIPSAESLRAHGSTAFRNEAYGRYALPRAPLP